MRNVEKSLGTDERMVAAVDADAGDHGRLRYLLAGDGVHANVSLSYFSIDPETGALRLLRPLDRDPPGGRSQWRLRVSASDGATEASTAVHVNLKDINDNAPFFPSATLNATVPENAARGTPVAQVTATDHDDPLEGSNARLVYSLEKNVIDEASGRPIFTVDSQLGLITTAICCLDREKAQRYAIQVVATDGGGLKGTGTVLVEVGDTNDTPPKFSKEEWLLQVPETRAPRLPLAFLSVLDQDICNNFTFRGGEGRVLFLISPRSDPEGRFGINGFGAVQLARSLDRETASNHTVLVLAVDDGVPQRTATATLTYDLPQVNVTDVNDNPPFLAEPRVVEVAENGPAQLVARVRLDDPDDWERGHGPPFTISLHPHAPPRGEDTPSLLSQLVGVARAWLEESKRGTSSQDRKGERKKRNAIREEARKRGRRKADDEEGRGKRRGIDVKKIRNERDVEDGGRRIIGGESPDAVNRVSEGVGVNEAGVGVRGDNVGVEVISVEGLEITSSTPVTRVWLTSSEDPHLSLLLLHRRRQLSEALGVSVLDVGVAVCTEADPGTTKSGLRTTWPEMGTTKYSQKTTKSDRRTKDSRTAKSDQGVTTKSDQFAGGKATLMTSRHLISSVMSAVNRHSNGSQGPDFEETEGRQKASSQGLPFGTQGTFPDTRYSIPQATRATRYSTPEVTRATLETPYSVVEAGTRAIVGPRVDLIDLCVCERHSQAPERTPPPHTCTSHTCTSSACTPHTCLNGGRCLPTLAGYKCICPRGTEGSRCKVLSRHFEGALKASKEKTTSKNSAFAVGGWAWLPSIPPCAEIHLSLDFLTSSLDATILYSGPGDDSRAPVGDSSDLLALELRDGRPSLLLDLGTGSVVLTINVSYSVSDSKWHRLDLMWKDETVELVLDLCVGGSMEDPPISTTTPPPTQDDTTPTPTDTNACRETFKLPRGARVLNTGHPLQIGGLAHPPPAHNPAQRHPTAHRYTAHTWPSPLVARPFRGCIRNVRINGEVRTLYLRLTTVTGVLYNASLTLLGSPPASGLLQLNAEEAVQLGGASEYLALGIVTVHRDYFDGEQLKLFCCKERSNFVRVKGDVLICAFLLHQHHRRSALRRGEGKGAATHPLRGTPTTTSCAPTPNLLEMQLLRPPRANGQPAWTRNPNIADVDVLQVDAASVTSSVEEQKRPHVSYTDTSGMSHGEIEEMECHLGGGRREDTTGKEDGGSKRGGGGGGGGSPLTGDDLRNYAYEGEGSSPGSLSSCLESCSGSGKFLDGFREVAHMLESWDPTNSQSAASFTSKTKRDASLPITNILCEVHTAIGQGSASNCSQFNPIGEQNLHSETIATPTPIPSPPRSFMS
ncbi:putative neural-cadherin 2 [Procambarus clarkii]|uniref:putative neural-cadherin 2 n=1 Tax=Procambarus clarkii TaxID=6728 RepID=UPI003743C3CF